MIMMMMMIMITAGLETMHYWPGLSRDPCRQNNCVFSPWEDVPLPTDPIDKQIELVSDRIEELEEALEDCFDDDDEDR